MIITCSQCQTRFRVDDSLIKETGTRVRCSNCQSVFTVFLPRNGEEARERPDAAIPRPPAEGARARAPIPQAPIPRAPEVPERRLAARPLPPALTDFYIPGEREGELRPSNPEGAPGGDLGLAAAYPGSAPAPAPRAPAQGAGTGLSQEAPQAPPREAPQDLYRPPAREAPEPWQEDPAPGPQADPGLGADPLAGYPANAGLEGDPAGGAPAGGDPRLAGFGESPDREAREEGLPRLGPLSGQEGSAPARGPMLQPRNRKPRDRRRLALAAAVAAALLTAGLYFWFSVDSSTVPGVAVQSSSPDALESQGGSSGPAAELADSTPQSSQPQMDNASLTRPDMPNSTEHLNFSKDLTAHHYRSNSEAGNILIITGRVENHFPDRRSYVRVKAVLKDSKGTVVAEREAFAGNFLTETELTTLPMSEILARLQLRGGQNSSNINIASGSSVPFMLVFDKLPADLAEYVVECVSSSPAGDVAESRRQEAVS
ncbi:MAG: zinc-ribbon domain-containing protein [Deltaproteobacteria bacterium]|nr:zinc-ribbon domain-containing protein [Deltaproteobacteria bacterium]